MELDWHSQQDKNDPEGMLCTTLATFDPTLPCKYQPRKEWLCCYMICMVTEHTGC